MRRMSDEKSVKSFLFGESFFLFIAVLQRFLHYLADMETLGRCRLE